MYLDVTHISLQNLYILKDQEISDFDTMYVLRVLYLDNIYIRSFPYLMKHKFQRNIDLAQS